MGFHKNLKRQLKRIQIEIDEEVEKFYQRLQSIQEEIEKKYLREENKNV